jgi:uncharacterized protein (DUF427 family)
MSQPASASATAAARPMPRVVPETQATRSSRRKLSSTPGTRRGYHRRVRPLSLEPVTWRVRVLAAGGRIVADSRAALLVLSTDIPPAYAFPDADCERDALPASAWRPLAANPGYAVLAPEHVEAILEEDEPLTGHPRSPYCRVDALASSRHVRVTLGGETLAESERPMAVFETDEPVRFYFAQADVRRDLLEPSETVTTSPYMGSAVWFAGRVAGESHADVAWTYRFPIPQLPRIAGLIAFRDDLVCEL